MSTTTPIPGARLKARAVFAVALICLTPVVLWLTAVPVDERFVDATTSLTSVGVLFGLLGTSAFAVNVILGARLKPVSAFVGGLEQMYFLHRVLGRVVLGLLVVHASLIIWSRALVSAATLRSMFVPDRGWAVIWGAVALCLLVVGIGLTLYARLSHEMFVYIQRGLGLAFGVGLLHVFMTPGTKAVSPELTAYLAFLGGIALLAYGYRSLFGNLLVRRYDYRVQAVDLLDPYVVELTMRPVKKRMSFVPGQFTFVTFYSDEFAAHFHPFSMTSEGSAAVIAIRPGDVHNQFHPFSITSSPLDEDLKIAVKAVGDYTSAMRRLDEGAAARLEGPYGTFSYLKVPGHDQIWIAGGIGVTPFLSMARSLEDAAGYKVFFFWGVKTRAQAYFLEELQAISHRVKSFHPFVVAEDEAGFITAEDIEAKAGALAAKEVLICGPPQMITYMTGQLLPRGVPRERIHFERFGFT